MRNLYVATILILVSFQVNAKKIQGEIILNNDEAINVTFIIPFGFLASEPAYIKLQTGVKYIDGSNKKVMLRPEDAKEISFAIDGHIIQYAVC